MKKYLLVFSSLIILLSLVSISLAQEKSTPKDTFRLAAGAKDGVYYPMALALEELIENAMPEVVIIVQSTEGSVENAGLLAAKSVHLAMIQSDIAYYFANGQRMFYFPSKKNDGNRRTLFGSYLFERNVNEGFNSIPRTLWTAKVYIVSGFEGFAPITFGGKAFSLFIFLAALAFLDQ